MVFNFQLTTLTTKTAMSVYIKIMSLKYSKKRGKIKVLHVIIFPWN
jgi:hypothetical protein